MALQFPTGHTKWPYPLRGHPGHARPCQCDQPLIDPHTSQCIRCGKYDKQTINQTFHERARMLKTKATR